jgi:transposase
MLADIGLNESMDVTCRLDFEPGEAAQGDFGAGPMLAHPDGRERRTWAFVLTLCFSRHQYVEFVWDQSSATWLGCHRRAFEWFGCVPWRVIIDNATCAITKGRPPPPLASSSSRFGYGHRPSKCDSREVKLVNGTS